MNIKEIKNSKGKFERFEYTPNSEIQKSIKKLFNTWGNGKSKELLSQVISNKELFRKQTFYYELFKIDNLVKKKMVGTDIFNKLINSSVDHAFSSDIQDTMNIHMKMFLKDIAKAKSKGIKKWILDDYLLMFELYIKLLGFFFQTLIEEEINLNYSLISCLEMSGKDVDFSNIEKSLLPASNKTDGINIKNLINSVRFLEKTNNRKLTYKETANNLSFHHKITLIDKLDFPPEEKLKTLSSHDKSKITNGNIFNDVVHALRKIKGIRNQVSHHDFILAKPKLDNIIAVMKLTNKKEIRQYFSVISNKEKFKELKKLINRNFDKLSKEKKDYLLETTFNKFTYN